MNLFLCTHTTSCPLYKTQHTNHASLIDHCKCLDQQHSEHLQRVGGVHLGAVASSVDRDGLGQVGRSVLQSLSSVGCHQLTHLTCFAEGQCAQPVLYTLSLHSNHCSIMLCTNTSACCTDTACIPDAIASYVAQSSLCAVHM